MCSMLPVQLHLNLAWESETARNTHFLITEKLGLHAGVSSDQPTPLLDGKKTA